ncbi:uncharacterized protein PHACADRAFT_257721 [Phanerochaete carnosa HHB-10118-sp]|uniref:Essential protein Yae1 N-terminal domain-containing protein n=1 Tax=Phanerochaete carnosa (strain HHB-10118-sp) TaxID=650164 RepID=K5UVP5_PHACS|nr:uncharacterized protein PHACADRAFT_257721 [Phanerochaete carnosa HHB-10118-sp]EKM54106.1 hypothetical protein PHACADRAFT_257721 [Phanerochaete carnosa HHB-10118-sp]
MLQDPGILRSLIAPKKSRRASASSQRSGSRERERSKDVRRPKKDSDAASVLTLVLAEEERQVHHMKAVLRATGDRLEGEMRRAESAEERARAAEGRARDALSRATTAEAARHHAELEATRAREEITRYRMLAEAAEREARRAETDVQRLERLKSEAEYSAADARDIARKSQQALREWQAREEGRLEGMRLEIRRRYDDGRDDGFDDGRAEGYEAGYTEGLEEGKDEGLHAGRTEGVASGRLIGFEEGKQVGFDDGFKEGYERGRREERVHAMEAFDKFLDAEKDRDSYVSSVSFLSVTPPVALILPQDEPDRIHQWVEATRHIPPPELRESMSPTPRYIRPPSPATEVREPAPLPVAPWLHRMPRATPVMQPGQPADGTLQ